MVETSGWVGWVIDLTDRFHVTFLLLSDRSQETSKCGKNKNVAHEAQLSVSLMFSIYFESSFYY